MFNPMLSYEENLSQGPTAQWNRGGFFPKIQFCNPPQFSVFDIPLHLPLGIPAGPLLSADFVSVALDAGFSMPVYKTVRSQAWKSHPWPNVLRLQRVCSQNISAEGFSNPFSSSSQEADSSLEDAQLWSAEVTQVQRPRIEVVPLHHVDLLSAGGVSITNAFGVPSASPDQWAADFSCLSETAFCSGQMTVLSFQGSRRDGADWHDFLDDTTRAADLAARCIRQKNGRILEMNVSCPNEAGAPIYTDLGALKETLCAAARALAAFPEIKLIVKLGAVPKENVLRTVEVVAKSAQGISAINTVSATILTPSGERALGSGAEHGGVCGTAIRAQALQMMQHLHEARFSLGLKKEAFALIGVGGCSSARDLQSFLQAGADVVHAATGAMWNLQLAAECAGALGIKFENKGPS